MAPDLQKLIHLQDLDLKIKQLREEISSLPKHIATREKTLEVHVRKLEADQAALAANQRERKKLEGEIQVQESKTSKLKDQMMEAKTNEQYRAFQKEIEYCRDEIHKAEDRILELMAESEPLERNVRTAQASLEVEKKKVEQEKQEAYRRTAEDKRQLEQMLSERQQLAAKITPKIYSAYERIRARRRGVAVAPASDGRCSACHLSLRPQFYQDLFTSEQVMFCESCGRILYCPDQVENEGQLLPEQDVSSNS